MKISISAKLVATAALIFTLMIIIASLLSCNPAARLARKQGVGECIGTTWGITAPELSIYLGRTATLEDMQNLTQETAAIIFKANYWNKFKGDRLNDYGICQDMIDATINQGLETGIKEIQEAAGLPVTMKMDENTIAHLNNKA